jgi:hypothetical protein
MKRLAPWIACLALFALLAAPLSAAAEAAKTDSSDKSPAAPYAKTLAAVTGVAISPMLGTAGLGVYQNLQAKTPEQKAALPWYAQWSFIIPAALLVGLVAAKDSLGTILPPGTKKPLDVLETIENKASGLVAAGAVVPFTMSSLSKMIVGSADSTTNAAAGSDLLLHAGTATVTIGAIDWSWLLNILTVPLGIAVFAIVWLASHAINALILLSPWGAIDAVLKGARTALLGLIPLVATLNPWMSLLLSLILVVVAYLVAGWAFRLTVFGAIFSWDFFTFRKKRYTVAEKGDNKLFSSNTLVKEGVPMRTYGRLRAEPENGKLVFRYRPWLVLPEKTADVKLESAAVGKGLFLSTIRSGEKTAFVLPPRYRDHEEKIAKVYNLEGGVQDAGLMKAWSALRELFGGSSAKVTA